MDFNMSSGKHFQSVKTINELINKINNSFNIDIKVGRTEVVVYCRIYIVRKMVYLNFPNRYIAKVVNMDYSKISSVFSLKTYNKEKYHYYKNLIETTI